MSTYITTILYRKIEVEEKILFNYIKQLPEKLQAPDLIPEEKFIHIDINSEVSAVFYVVNGLNSKVKCFNLQCELFREESLLFLIKNEIGKHQKKYSLYSHLYCDMDGFQENLKITENGFEEISCMDGEYTITFKDGESPTEQIILDTEELRKKYPIYGILNDLGITEEDINNAAYRLEQDGTIL
ncbi:MAG TPA: hypothetical protein VHQ24_16605 [Lachnospiraceae bacterium]|nr:hypothetical protein [Lachnospiraceae bacterium]